MRPPFEGSTDSDTVEMHRPHPDQPPPEQADAAGPRESTDDPSREGAKGREGARAPERAQSGPDGRRYRAAVRSFRSRRTVAATLVAAVIAVVTILLAIEVISHLVGSPINLFRTGDLAELGSDTQWTDPLPVIIAVVVGLLGLLLLALAILPGRSRVVPVDPHREHATLVLRPATLEQQAVRAAESVPGVDQAEARTHRNQLRVRVHSSLREPGDLSEQVRGAVAERLAAVAPLREPRLDVDLRYEKE